MVARLLPRELSNILQDSPKLAVAFSGGVDSRFLCHAALLCGCEVLVLHAHGPHIPAQDTADALLWAHSRALHVLDVPFDPLPLPEVSTNSRLRCYACKRGMIAAMKAALRDHDPTAAPLPLCDGSNADDMRSFRPGLQALTEAGVYSPLATAGLSKKDIRRLAADSGMDRPQQQARPCLLTRLAYGLPPDTRTLARLSQAETALTALLSLQDKGELRLRLTPSPILQVTSLPPSEHGYVHSILAAHGFSDCEIRIGPQVSGFFDTQQ